MAYDQARARRIAGESIRKEAASKNRPADLINIALEKVVEAGLELPAFSTFDAMASTLRKEVNAEICGGIHERMSAFERAGLLRLLEERESDGTTLYNRLKKPAQGPTWSHFKNLAKRLEWVDGLGDTGVWMDDIAAGKITDFAGEADAADVAELRDYKPVKRLAQTADRLKSTGGGRYVSSSAPHLRDGPGIPRDRRSRPRHARLNLRPPRLLTQAFSASARRPEFRRPMCLGTSSRSAGHLESAASTLFERWLARPPVAMQASAAAACAFQAGDFRL